MKKLSAGPLDTRWISTEDMVVGNTYRVSSSSTDWVFVGMAGLFGAIRADYSGKEHILRPRSSVIEVIKVKEDTMTTKKLYEITTTGSVMYGHKLAVDSSGKWVMEVKGSGQVTSFDKKYVNEVVPYSVSIQYNDGVTSHYGAYSKAGVKTYDYLAVQNDWEVGDIVIVTGSSNIATVTSIDVKSTKATVWLTGFKVQGSFIKSGE